MCDKHIEGVPFVKAKLTTFATLFCHSIFVKFISLRKACSKEQIEKQVSDHETVVIRVWLMLRLS